MEIFQQICFCIVTHSQKLNKKICHNNKSADRIISKIDHLGKAAFFFLAGRPEGFCLTLCIAGHTCSLHTKGIPKHPPS